MLLGAAGIVDFKPTAVGTMPLKDPVIPHKLSIDRYILPYNNGFSLSKTVRELHP